MDSFAIAMLPIARPAEWRSFCKSVSTGPRAQEHREFLNRMGVEREHVFHQTSRSGDMAVLVWEGMNQKRAPRALEQLLRKPRSEYERYLVGYVLPSLHGVDSTAGPPPEIEKVATIETAVKRGTKRAAPKRKAAARGRATRTTPKRGPAKKASRKKTTAKRTAAKKTTSRSTVKRATAKKSAKRATVTARSSAKKRATKAGASKKTSRKKTTRK